MINSKEVPTNSGIYKIINKINNKIYIGKAINLRIRVNKHKGAKDSSYFYRAIKRYGWENFELEILQEWEFRPTDKDLLDELTLRLLALEIAYIDFYDATNRSIGYNVYLFGGDPTGTRATQETKEKMSKSQKGKKRSEESKANMSKGQKGSKAKEKHPFWGKQRSEETKKKISLSHQGKTMSPEAIAKRLEKIVGNYTGEKAFNFDDTIYKFKHKKTNEIFIGTQFALRTKFDIGSSDMSCLIKGKQKSAKGWVLIDN